MVKLEDCRRYFQYIADDKSQLSSSVIKVFREKYPLRSNPDLEELATGEAECYIHTDVRFGLRESLWEKVGKAYIHDNFDAKFIVEPHDGLDSMWTVWIINGPRMKHNELPKEFWNAEQGYVIPAEDALYRIEQGKHYGYWDDPTNPHYPFRDIKK